MLKRLLGARRSLPAAHWNDEGIRRWQANELAAARDAFRKALQADPSHAGAASNLGALLLDDGREDEALALLAHAVDLAPDDAAARVNLANGLVQTNRLAEGVAHFREALRLDPGHALARRQLLKPLLDLCEWEAASAETDRLVADWQRVAGRSPPPGSWHRSRRSSSPCPDAFRLEIARRYAARVAAKAAPHALEPAAPDRRRPPPRRLRLGRLLEPRHRPPRRGNVRAARPQPLRAVRLLVRPRRRERVPPADRRRVRAFRRRAQRARARDRGADRARSHPDPRRPEGLHDRESPGDLRAAARAAAAELPRASRERSARRGWTTWSPTASSSPSRTSRSFDERAIWLPGSYQVNDDRRAHPAAAPAPVECGLPADAFVFCAFNQHAKINAAIFAAWLRVLDAVPESVLWLLAGPGEPRLRAAAAAAGVDPARLVFAPRMPMVKHLARHRLARTVPRHRHLQRAHDRGRRAVDGAAGPHAPRCELRRPRGGESGAGGRAARAGGGRPGWLRAARREPRARAGSPRGVACAARREPRDRAALRHRAVHARPGSGVRDGLVAPPCAARAAAPFAV